MATGTPLKGAATHIAIQYFIGFLIIVKCRVFIRHQTLENSLFTTQNSPANIQVQVFQKMDSVIHQMNHYLVDKYLGNQLRYPLDRDLSTF